MNSHVCKRTSSGRRALSLQSGSFQALIAGLALVGLSHGPSAIAQQASEDAASRPGGVEEIVVTARRRAESLQDTPISISAVTSEGLAQRGIDNVTQIGDFTPNVKFNSSVPVSASNATAAIFIRGIGQNDYQLSADPGVGLYLDGVYISRGVGNVLDVLNVERIEVLRGPQGTLFGRNTIGGAVSVVTKKPADKLGASLDLTTGSFNRVQIKGSIDVPLADGVYTSLSGFYHMRDGYVKGTVPLAPDLGDTNTLAGRFALRLEPTSTLSINLAVDGTRSREKSAPNVMLAVDENAPAAQVWNGVYSGAAGICTNLSNPARLSDTRCYNSQWAQAPYRHGGTFQTISDTFNNFGRRRYESASDLNIWGVSGTVEWKLGGGITAKSITAYRKVTGFWTRDSDHSPASIVQTKSDWKQDQFSEEFQLLGDAFDSRLNWVVGGYYSKESGNHKDLVNIIDAVFLSGAILDGRSLAAFGQATFEIVHNLSLTGGIRWTEDKKTFDNGNQYVVEAGFLTGLPFNPDGSGLQNGDPLMGPRARKTITDRAWTPMASLSYRWSPEFLTYASYSQGFKGGGFTQRVFPPFANIPSFRPETSTTYEVGFKSDLLGRHLRLNGAAFVNDYDDLQITVNDPILGFAPIIQNAAKARIKGVELELQARPTEELKLEAGLGYLDAKYRQVDIRALNSGVTKDTHLQNAPKWTLSAGASYDIDVVGVGKFTPRVDWSYRSTVYNDAVNSPLLIQNGYHLVNASIAYRDEPDTWLITLGVKNLTKQKYLGSGYVDSFGGITEGAYGRPREWFLSARRTF
ncbi:TonB-dependent receptor [Sphingobium sp. EM0848]|uniref:TonB-dependent receptor n=1 Tax=Sphingobium sp. EM0848 TaxID=2743473 RepID=UPI00159C9F73|nr:TonB-dependent receptor [Sphingobium sp. EM0848]